MENWKECLEENFVLKISPDKAKAKSLIETANGRVDYVKNIILNESNANYIFEDYYSSILEYLHALVILDGYKVINHLCLGYYLKEILKKEGLFRIFDDLRFKRNGLVYYGKRMEFEVSLDAINKCKKLIRELKESASKKLQG